MKKVKLYLSKPNNVDKGVLDKVLEHLSHYDVDVSYHSPGTEYNGKYLDEADLMLVLPKSFKTKPEKGSHWVSLSKGVYGEINYCIDEGDFPILMVTHVNEYDLYMTQVKNDLEVVNPNDWVNDYGRISIDNKHYTLSDLKLFGIQFNIKRLSSPSVEKERVSIGEKTIELQRQIQDLHPRPRPMLTLWKGC